MHERQSPSPLHFAVLRRREETVVARKRLRKLGIDLSESRLRDKVRRRARRALGREEDRPLLRPDPVKSWDVLKALEAITGALPPEGRVLDMGSLGSPILPALATLGYTDLHGIDLDPDVLRMPGGPAARYTVGDMMRTPWPDRYFSAITAISVIEHGFAEQELVSEVARLLKPGGLFVLSTDYWPTTVDTAGVRPFGLPWRVFTPDDVRSFARRAASADLQPVGGLEEALSAALPTTPPIAWAGRRYTFLYGVFVRRPGP